MELSVDRSIRHWWVFLLRGILFIAVGVYIICSPGTGYAALGFMFGLIIFLAGISELLHVYRDNSSRNRGWHLFLGIMEVIFGIVLIGNIAASVDILRIIIGIWFLFRGMSLLSFSGFFKRSVLLAIGGIITIIFGAMILFNAAFGAMTIILVTAIAFIVTGLFNTVLAFGMKSASKIF
jgi:uncharacterized membrane protein HdeD (DUF308 family)